MLTGATTKRGLSTLLLSSSLMLLAGCGVINDSLGGFGTPGPSPSADPAGPGATGGGLIVVTIEIDSDVSTANDLAVEIESPSTPQSLRENQVQVPFSRDLTVSMNTAFPLRATTVRVNAAPGAAFVSCSISVAGQVVATHRSEGSGATATCERRLQLGRS